MLSPAGAKCLDVIEDMRRAQFDREQAGGELSQDEAVVFVAALDDLWWQLSDEEHAEIERVLVAQKSAPSVDAERSGP